MRKKPHCLLDELQRRYHFANDAQLGQALQLEASVISRIRHGVLPVSAGTILAVHEAFGMTVKEIKQLAAKQKEADEARERIAAKAEPTP